MALVSEPTAAELDPDVLGSRAGVRQSAGDIPDTQIAEKANGNHQIGDTITPPILYLPPEIFAQIFTNVMQSRKKSYKKGVRKLMLVCKAWKDIVIGTPAVWSFIDYDDGQAYVRAALRNSRNYPLTIWQDAWDDIDRFQCFIEDIVKHSRRWMALDLSTIPWPEDIFKLVIEASAPILRSFSIKDTSDEPGGYYWPTLFKGQPLPCLQHLKIVCFDVGLEPKSLTALEYLCVALDYQETETPRITPDILAAVLRNNPKLSYVCLEGTAGAGPRSKTFRPSCSDPINLPHLRSLDFYDTHPAYVKAVKPFLVAPCKPYFEIRAEHEKDSEEDEGHSAVEQEDGRGSERESDG